MGKRNALQSANNAADIAEARAREAKAKKAKAFADVQRLLVWPLVLTALFSGSGWLLWAFKTVPAVLNRLVQ